MFRGASDKFDLTVIPKSVATSATATATIDLAGVDFCQVVWAGDTASTNPAVLKLTEGDTTTAGTAIGAATGDDTTDGFTIPAVDTSNGCVVVFNVDARKRKRYLKFWCNPGATQVMSVVTRKGRRSQIVTGATGQNVDAIVEI